MSQKESSNGMLAVVVIGIIALVIIMSMLARKEVNNVFVPKVDREQKVSSE